MMSCATQMEIEIVHRTDHTLPIPMGALVCDVVDTMLAMSVLGVHLIVAPLNDGWLALVISVITEVSETAVTRKTAVTLEGGELVVFVGMNPLATRDSTL